MPRSAVDTSPEPAVLVERLADLLADFLAGLLVDADPVDLHL
jgi:hypothetical protein